MSSAKCENRILKKGDILVHDNCTMRVISDNSELSQILRSVGAGMLTLLVRSPELISIELFFNVMVQRIASRFNESNASADRHVLNLFCSVFDLITLDIVFSCCKKCGYSNFQ